jgi:serine phosphatase RsbU (regulator of sigma subunit)
MPALNPGSWKRPAACLPGAVFVVTAALAVTAGTTGSASGPEVVTITDATVKRGIVLRDGWRFRAGDDPEWAKKTYDDSGWGHVDSGVGPFGPDWQGVGWLRRRLRVDPSCTETVVGLSIHQAGASEIYFDGRRVASLGVVSGDAGKEVARAARFPVALALEAGREHVLAVRFSLAHEHEVPGGLRGITVIVGTLDARMEASTRTYRRLIPFMAAAAGLAGALALVHGLLFLFDRRATEHAYMAVFASFLALDVFADMMTNLIADHDVSLSVFRLGVVFLVAMLLSGIQLELVIFRRPRGRVFWVLTVIGAAMVIWAWSIPAHRNILVLVVFMVLAVAEMLRLAVEEFLRRRPDSAVVAAGLAILALSFVNFFFGYFGLPHVPSGVSLLIGWGGAAVSLSVYIARRASRTNLELRERLDEIAALTRRTVEQERRVARELTERRILEADNERKTREIERARALQVAMLPDCLPRLPELEIAVRMRTATEVGGDYYDFVGGGDAACTLAVGDATGHGMHAGMVVAVAKSLFTTLAPSTGPGQVLREVSLSLARLRRRAATMALAIIRIQGARLEISGTAMPPLLLWRCVDRTIEELPLSGLPLGHRLVGEIPNRILDLAAGDALLVSTDGLAEALDPGGDTWGYERVARAFARTAAHGPEQALDKLLEAMEAFTESRPLLDDVTVVALQARRGPGRSSA